MSINNDIQINAALAPLPGVHETNNTIAIGKDWDQVILEYKDNMQTIDLRSLDTAQVVSAVLRELPYLHTKNAFLFVLHNHLPVILLDQLEEQKIDYHIKIIAPGEVQTLVFRQ